MNERPFGSEDLYYLLTTSPTAVRNLSRIAREGEEKELRSAVDAGAGHAINHWRDEGKSVRISWNDRQDVVDRLTAYYKQWFRILPTPIFARDSRLDVPRGRRTRKRAR